MSLAPPGANRPRAAFSLLELLVVLALVAALAGLVLGAGRRAVEAGKCARARAELAVLATALAGYQRAYGDFPRTGDAAVLLQALLGRRDPTGAACAGRAVIDVERFTIAEARDPSVDATAELADPWGRPYRYAYRSLMPWTNPEFVLYSRGPDGRDAPALVPGGFPDETAPENADNIWSSHP